MAGPGGGPSRRSHTKSRKGCKTCKRRHIRCDESFPQCRNCSKHQVRCDYMDSPNMASPDSPDGSVKANLLWSREIEDTIDVWQSTGAFPFPELRVYPQPHWARFSKVELRLIHHLSSIANEMLRGRCTKLTTWSEYLPKILSISASHHFVMQAMLAFSASHLAWISQSSETKALASQYASSALKGLQQTIQNPSRENCDALIASSLLLQWVASDWRSWASLVSSTSTIISMMQPWKHESVFAEFINDHSASFPQVYMNPAGTMVTPESRREHTATLEHLRNCLHSLPHLLIHYEQEREWIEQLTSFINRLRTSSPAQSTEEQFSQLYALRKWLFWVPISLLAVRSNDPIVLTVLSYFYAAALALEPMFPDVGSAFCSTFALQPLEEIIRTIDAWNVQQGSYNPAVASAAQAIAYTREITASYRSRRQRTDSVGAMHTPSYYDPSTTNINLENAFPQFTGSAQSLSPAAPSPLSYLSSQSSPFDPPRSSIDYSTISSTSGYMSPLISPSTVLPYTTHEENYTYQTTMPINYASGDRYSRHLPLQLPHISPTGPTLPSIMDISGKGKGPAYPNYSQPPPSG